ncbi:hypothetical protein ACP70R_018691 [Stipagrostis hirtigluma subsp. patula]
MSVLPATSSPWHPSSPRPPPPPRAPVMWASAASLLALVSVASLAAPRPWPPGRARPPPPYAPSGSRLLLLRRGLAMIPSDHSPGPDLPPADCYDPYCFDPEAPGNQTCFAYDEKDLASEEAMWALYERWCSFYEVRRDHDDMVRRFQGFKAKAREIHEFNKSGKSYTKGLFETSDWTPEELSKRFRRQLL